MSHTASHARDGMLTTFEVCRSRPRDQVAYIAAIDKCRGVAHRMQTLVESLLLLAHEAGQLPLKLQSTDAADLLDDCWAMLTAPRGSPDEAAMASRRARPHGNRPRKCGSFSAIFDNAVSYADDAGSIRIAAELRGNEFHVEVSADTGSHIGAEQEKRALLRAVLARRRSSPKWAFTVVWVCRCVNS